MGTRKIGPAIAAGCTMVVKPAEQTPLTMLALAATLEEAGLPAGVLNVVTTSDSKSLSKALMADDRLRKVSFTGSTGGRQGARPAVRRPAAAGLAWSSAATRRSSSSRTPTSTRPSTAR